MPFSIADWPLAMALAKLRVLDVGVESRLSYSTRSCTLSLRSAAAPEPVVAEVLAIPRLAVLLHVHRGEEALAVLAAGGVVASAAEPLPPGAGARRLPGRVCVARSQDALVVARVALPPLPPQRHLVRCCC